MRHSSIDLTMNTYTDPKLLDVQGAVEALPNLDLGESLVPLLVLKSVPESPKVAIPVISLVIADLSSASEKQGISQGKSRDSQDLRVTTLSGRYRDRTCDPFRVKDLGNRM